MSENGPPLNISSEELALTLTTRPRPSKIVEFPGLEGGRIRIMIPPMRDNQEARSLAEATVRKELKARLNREPTADDLSSHVSQNLIGDETAMEMLARCCWSVEPISEGDEKKPPVYKRLFPDAKWIRNTLDADTIAILFSAYQCVKHECGPNISVMSEDEINAWVDRLKDGAWALGPLAPLAWLDLAELTLSACKEVSRLRSSGFQTPESQPESLPTGSESQSTGSPMGTTSSGEHVETNTRGTNELITAEEAAAIAKTFRE